MTTHNNKFQAIKGVRDILPPESALWNRVEQTAREVFGTYAYGEIRLPIFEPAELFARSVGAETDIVNKEMYVFDLHGSSNLEYARDAVTGQYGEVLPSARDAAREVEAFIRQIDAALSEDRLQRTGDNVDAIENLKHLYSTLHDIRTLREDQLHPDEWDDAQTLLSEQIRQWALKIEIGSPAALRPEATASVVRAYIEHGMQTLPSPVKLYYMGPMFRRERPQKGRYRQFYQIGAEVLGPNIAHFAIDADVISMLMTFFDECGLNGHVLYINSLGCNNCRPAFVARLREELLKVKDNLSSDSQRRIQTNTLRVLDSKVPGDQEIIEHLPKILDYLCDECRDHFEGLKDRLQTRGIKFIINPRLVRGLDYYVRTTFEVTAPGQGSQDAICGGGRYDGLVELIGGSKFKDIKGVGFAIGEDRLIQALQYEGVRAPAYVDVLVAWKDQGSREHAEKIAQALRFAGLIVEMPARPVAPREGLGLANKRGIPIGVVIGPEEVSAAAFSVRLLSEADQVLLTQGQLSQNLGRLLKFRVLVERGLEETAIINGLNYRGLSIEQLAANLIERGLLGGHIKALISRAMHTFNTLIHDGEVAAEQQSEAVAASLMVLSELVGKHPMVRLRIE